MIRRDNNIHEGYGFAPQQQLEEGYPLVPPPPRVNPNNNNSEDDWLSTAIGCLICIAFLVLFLFILSYPVSGSYRYEPDTDRHHVYFRANPNAYPYAP